MIQLEKIVLIGGNRLQGTVKISGAKNAVLPIMAASLLADGDYHISNVPLLRDVKTMTQLLESIGCHVTREKEVVIHTGNCQNPEAPYDLVKTMRASIYVLGPLLTRFGYAKVSLPGGCAWGPRPVNLHIESLQKMGAKIDINQGYIIAKAQKLKGAHIVFDVSSVGATGNVLMAAVLAKGVTVIENAAQEPEITTLAHFLKNMGANIRGIGTKHLEIEGVDSLYPRDVQIIPDRIEAGTFLIAGHMTGGHIRLENVDPEHITEVINKLRDSGAVIKTGKNWLQLQSSGQIHPVDMTTSIYPGFPTDMQAQWLSLMSIANGSAIVTDTVFEDRFTHVPELQRLGANITVDHNIATVKGVRHLSGAQVMSTDLRASACLILAGLVANGRTDISRVYHIDRGYEKIEEKLKALGAEIWRDNEKLIT
jgi:UDP-N-acetylglucosamine 1-carboxyvinyltransferase